MTDWLSAPLDLLASFRKGRKGEVRDSAQPGFAPYLGASVLAGGAVTQFARTNGAVIATENDVLMLWDGERSGLVGMGQPGVVSSTVSRLTPKPSITGALLYYLLEFHFEWIQARRTGTGVPHVPKDLSRILYLRFPLDSACQERIAEILSTVDEAIDQTEALIAKTQQIKAGLMNDLFTRGVTGDGQLRPPREEAPHLYKESLLGWMPKVWESKTAVECASGAPGSTTIGPFGSDLIAADYQESGVPVVFVRDVKVDGFEWNSRVYVTDEKAQQLSAHTVRADDIVVTKMGLPPCIACRYPVWMPPGIVTADIIRLRPDVATVDPRWLTAALNCESTRRQVLAITAGVTRPKVTLGDFRTLLLPCPPHAEQVVIADCLSLIDDAGDTENQRLSKLKQLRQGLMHDLLTGCVVIEFDASSKATEVAERV